MGTFSALFLASSKRHNSTRPGVQKTAELARILALPRRVLDLDAGTSDGQPLLDISSLYLTNPGPCSEFPRCPLCGSGRPVCLWPTQTAALLEADKAEGLFAPLGVGAGKTIISLLLPDVLESRRTVLLVPASLKSQLLGRDVHDYGRHFAFDMGKITVVSYTELSTAETADVLDEVKPDLIVADEVHSLAKFSSARTKRWIRYMTENPSTRFCGLSGTITKRSLRDFAHLTEASLRHNSPLPKFWNDLQEWADALDPILDPLPVGALRAFSDIEHPKGSDEERAAARDGFRRRLVETPGVVATSSSWEGASLVVSALRPKVPGKVEHALDELRRTWQIEDEEIDSIMRLTMVARQIASGFYYRWVWPGGVRDREWLEGRAAWHRAVRETLKSSRAGLDSPLLVARAAERGDLGVEATAAWLVWKGLRDRYDPHPPIEAVWIDDFIIRAAWDWAGQGVGEYSIVWYKHDAVGELLSRHFPVYGPGTDAGEARAPVIACSVAAQGTGKNLQHYSRNLILEPTSSGATLEQLIGRTHRPGQQADEVTFDVLMHSLEHEHAMVTAVSDAHYVQETQGQRQKILSARRIGW